MASFEAGDDAFRLPDVPPDSNRGLATIKKNIMVGWWFQIQRTQIDIDTQTNTHVIIVQTYHPSSGFRARAPFIWGFSCILDTPVCYRCSLPTATQRAPTLVRIPAHVATRPAWLQRCSMLMLKWKLKSKRPVPWKKSTVRWGVLWKMC